MEFNKLTFAVDRIKDVDEDYWLLYHFLFDPKTNQTELADPEEVTHPQENKRVTEIGNYIKHHHDKIVKSSVFHVETSWKGREFVDYFEKDPEIDGKIPIFVYRYDLSNYHKNEYELC